jgi:hypothetical protein
MKFVNTVDICTAWTQIQNLVLPLCKEVEVGQAAGNNLDNNIKKKIELILGTKRSIVSAILFTQGPKRSQSIHVDGYRLDRAGARNWALNIPIRNTLDSEQIWYNGQYMLESREDPGMPKYLELQWLAEKEEAYRCVIRQPTLVRINIPHHVINYSDQSRFMLSVRFDPDLDGETSVPLII